MNDPMNPMNPTDTIRIPLVRIAHARSGDKADWVDFGLFAWNAASYTLLAREVTTDRVRAHFAPWLPGEVNAWPLPNLLAIKLVLRDALQGGGARNLRLDNLGKSMAGALLRMEIEVTPIELAQALASPRVGWWGDGLSAADPQRPQAHSANWPPDSASAYPSSPP